MPLSRQRDVEQLQGDCRRVLDNIVGGALEPGDCLAVAGSCTTSELLGDFDRRRADLYESSRHVEMERASDCVRQSVEHRRAVEFVPERVRGAILDEESRIARCLEIIQEVHGGPTGHGGEHRCGDVRPEHGGRLQAPEGLGADFPQSYRDRGACTKLGDVSHHVSTIGSDFERAARRERVDHRQHEQRIAAGALQRESQMLSRG